MEYTFSTLLDASTHDTDGLCQGVPLRMHRDTTYEDLGAIRAQEDWRNHVGPLDNYKGGLGPMYRFVSCNIPECLPDRLEIVSYANEFAFLHDDVVDIMEKAEADKENGDMLQALQETITTGCIHGSLSGKQHLIVKIFRTTTKIDMERAMVSFGAWAEFIQKSGDKQRYVQFDTLDGYLEYRTMDIGEKFWFGLMTFGMGLTIPKEEYQTCYKICRPAYVHFSLINDLFSWEKECEAAIASGESDIINGLSVLMQEHSVSLNQAKVLCRQRIIKAAAEFVTVLRETRGRQNLSPDLCRYVEALQYTMSGHVAWAMTCPRYHKHAEYNEGQLHWTRYGTPQPINGDDSETDYGVEGDTLSNNHILTRDPPSFEENIQLVRAPQQALNRIWARLLREGHRTLNTWFDLSLKRLRKLKAVVEKRF